MRSGATGRAKRLGPLLTQEPALKHFLHPTQLLAAVSPPPLLLEPLYQSVSSLSPFHPERSLEKRMSFLCWKAAVAPV